MVLEKIDFTLTDATATIPIGIWLLLIFASIAAFCGGLGVLLTSNRLNKLKLIGLILMMLIGFISFVTLAVNMTSNGNLNDKLNTRFHGWVQDTYMIDLTDEQIKEILSYQFDNRNTDVNMSMEKGTFVKTSTGDLVSVRLIRTGEHEWVLFKLGESLLETH